MLKNVKEIEKVKALLNDYLEKHNHRKTPERFAILEEIYRSSDHFDVETLYISMKKKNYRVSRATLYNTIDLLLDAQLITKLQFDGKTSWYEKSVSNKNHHHLFCKKCNSIIEFSDDRINDIIEDAGLMNNFKVKNYSLNIYGICSDCMKDSKKVKLKYK